MKKHLLLLAFLVFTISLKAQTTVTDTADHTIYTAVQVPPSFAGGNAGLAKFMMKNLRYPAVDREKYIQGKVYVQVVVEKDGSLSDIKILRTPSETIGAEAIRLTKSMPKWTPGVQNGMTKRVQYTFPISFSLM